MTIKATQMEDAILAILHPYQDGKRDASITQWRESIKERFGEYPRDDNEIVSALKRLRDNDLIWLLKVVEQPIGWYNYARDERVNEGWFFYKASFVVQITDKGRGFWDVQKEAYLGFTA